MTATAPSASILVVDDTVENLRVLASMLGEHGYEVRPVTGGRQALQAAQSAPPDLILLDISMPEMDGYQVCTQLKADPGLAEVPVIFLTALSDLADKVKAFRAGGADYVTKPFQMDEVLARVRVHLALRAASVRLSQQLEQLRALEKLRDDLVNMVVHDMRTPITVLLHNLNFLKDDGFEKLGEQASEDLGAAITAAKGLNRMANELLDVSRLEEGKLPLALERNDLVPIAESLCTALAGLDRSRRLAVEASGRTVANCDRGIVHRVIENLVSNAIKHTPAGGAIRVVLSTEGSRIRCAVHDEGAGIPAEARERIFEKFATVQARRQSGFHSAGLGLAFCKLAVGAHGGTIGVEPRQPTGSTFWFELPT